MLRDRSPIDILHGVLLLLCVSLPWLNPFSSSPSASVIPLLVSWMLSACALLVVADWSHPVGGVTRRQGVLWGVLGVWFLGALLCVPEVVDRALTLGLFAALTCIAVMAMVGRRVLHAGASCMAWLVAGWLLAAALSSVLGLLQYLDMARELAPWVNQPLRGDAFANLRQRNQFGSLTSIGLVVLLGWVGYLVHAGKLTSGARLLAWLLLILLAAGVSASVSRTGAAQWLCVSVLAVALAWAEKRRGKSVAAWMQLCIAAPLLVVVWSLVLPELSLWATGQRGASLLLRVTGQAQDYGVCGSRGVLWRNALAMLSAHPWLGWGWGETDYAHFMTLYSGTRFCDMLDNAHNLPLHLALEFGLPLALVLIGSAAVWVLRRRPWLERAPWRVMAWGLLLVLALHSLLEYPLWYGPFQMTLGLALGLLTSRGLQGASSADVQPSSSVHTALQPWLQAWPLLLGGALFVACLYAAWDFQRVGQIYRSPAARDAMYRDNPLDHARQSWLFRNQAEFAELTLHNVTADNATYIYPLAQRVMHYSPEPRVAQRAIDSARLLGLELQAQAWEERLQVVQHNQPSTPASSSNPKP